MTDTIMDHRTALERVGASCEAVGAARHVLAQPDPTRDPRLSLEDRVRGAMAREDLEQAILDALDENEALFSAGRRAQLWSDGPLLVLGKLPASTHLALAAHTMIGGR